MIVALLLVLSVVLNVLLLTRKKNPAARKKSVRSAILQGIQNVNELATVRERFQSIVSFSDGKQLPGKLPTTHIVHGATPWTDYRIQLSPPQDAAKLKIECFADDASGTVWFDACSLTEEAGR